MTAVEAGTFATDILDAQHVRRADGLLAEFNRAGVLGAADVDAQRSHPSERTSERRGGAGLPIRLAGDPTDEALPPGIVLRRLEHRSALVPDAEAARVYANSFGKDADFYEFYRAMQSYQITFLGDGNQPPAGTNIILSPDNDYLKEFTGRGR